MPSITQALSGSSTQQQPRSRLMSIGLGALAVGQLVALGMLCSQQVQKAQARDSNDVVQRMALSDCLQYVPGSTIASCRQRVDLARLDGQRTRDVDVTGAVPVKVSFR